MLVGMRAETDEADVRRRLTMGWRWGLTGRRWKSGIDQRFARPLRSAPTAASSSAEAAILFWSARAMRGPRDRALVRAIVTNTGKEQNLRSAFWRRRAASWLRGSEGYEIAHASPNCTGIGRSIDSEFRGAKVNTPSIRSS